MTGEHVHTFVPCKANDHGNCVAAKSDHGIAERCDCICHRQETAAGQHPASGDVRAKEIREYLDVL